MKIKTKLSVISSCFMGLAIGYAVADGNTSDLPAYGAGLIPSTSSPTYQNKCSDCTLSGIYQWGGGLPVYGDNVTINEAGYMGYGIYVNGDTRGFSVGVVIGDNLSVTTTGDHQDGLRTMGNQSLAGNPNFIVVGNDARIVTTGYSADGINAGYTAFNWSGTGNRGSAEITLGDRAYIETSGDSAHGISANAVLPSATNKVTLGDNAVIITNGQESHGVRAGNRGSEITLGDNSTIITNGADSIAVSATSASRVNLGKDVVVNVNKEAGQGIYAGSSAIVTLEGGATVVTAGNKNTDSYALNAIGGVIDGSVQGVYHIQGDLNASGRLGQIDLNMAEGSTWKGASYLNNLGTTNIEMNSTRWDMTDSSSLSLFDTTNSQVNFLSSEGDFLTLSVNELQGSGSVFGMNVDMGNIAAAPNANGERIGIAGVDGDLLKVESFGGNDSYKLNIASVGSAQTQGNEVLQVVETSVGDTSDFSLTNSRVDLGGYEYALRASGNDDGYDLYGTGQRSTSSDAATSFLNINYLLSYIDTQSLLQRMGELRDKQEGDLWIRGIGGKLNAFSGQKLQGFDMNYRGTQIGIDKRLDTWSGQAYVGVMGGIIDADPNFRGGDGSGKNTHFGLYGSYVLDNGFYVDGVAKYNFMKNRFNVRDSSGTKVRGKGSSNGYSASLEAGKRFSFGEDQVAGLYIEPQAQITYGHQDGMSINVSNGLKAKLGDYDYLLGRASGVVGYQIAGTTPVNVYFKSGYVREMDASASYKINGQKNSYNFRGSWWDNAVGVNATINKSHNVYADVNYASGSRFDQRQLNLGYRYSF